MTEYKHILLAVDLSENTPSMISETKYIIEQCNAKLSIVHVLELLPLAYETDLPLLNENIQQHPTAESETQQKLYELGKQFNISKTSCYLKTGPIKIAITELAKDLDVDLIIIGSNSHHGIEKLLSKLGNAILSIAPCSVLVMKLKGLKNEK